MPVTNLTFDELTLFDSDDHETLVAESPHYLSKQLITYIGNKRGLSTNIERAILAARSRLGGRKLSALDLFSGSGFVTRLLKKHSQLLIANDLEAYSEIANRCFLTNYGADLLRGVGEAVANLNRRVDAGESRDGFVREMYSPVDDQDIQLGERVFYTNENASRLDFYAQEIASLDEPLRSLILGPLLSQASMYANTSGVFKGFYKDKHTGIGKFGAAAGDALKRILQPISLEVPILSKFQTESLIYRRDANALVEDLPELDLVYIDPPYNQHPYGSNYFMLNLLVDYRRPVDFSQVSGIPTDWKRSGYNVRKQSLPLVLDLVKRLPARFLLVSFNAEGYVQTEDLRSALDAHGHVDEFVIPYNTFRGSRNLRDRAIHVNEHLFLMDREG